MSRIEMKEWKTNDLIIITHSITGIDENEIGAKENQTKPQ